MRRSQGILGSGLLIACIAITIRYRDDLVEPNVRENAAWLHPGMTVAEAEEVMGRRGESIGFLVSGDPQYYLQNDVFKYRWEDATGVVEVLFDGPKGQARASYIKVVRDHTLKADLWFPRLGLAVIAVFGVGFLVQSLRAPA